MLESIIRKVAAAGFASRDVPGTRKDEDSMMSGTQNRLLVAGCVVLLLGFSMTFGARKMQRLSNGTWGGQHIRFEVNDESVSIEYDCAHGAIEGPLTVDRQGRFSWRGTLTRERGGPVRLGAKVNNLPATYAGSIKDDTMTLTVKVENSSDEPETYTLTRGSVGRVLKCR